MNTKKRISKIMAMVLTAVLVFSITPLTALAETLNDCAHSHDAVCGYIEAADCEHGHDTVCGWAEAESCHHSYGDDCGGYGADDEPICAHYCGDGACDWADEIPCGHSSHDDGCGYMEERPCLHICDETCESLMDKLGDQIKDIFSDLFNGTGQESFMFTVEKDGVTFFFESESEYSNTLYLTEGEPVTDAMLLEGVGAEDENGVTLAVEVIDTDGLNMDDPQPKDDGEAYKITYEAGGVSVEREAYVIGGFMMMAAVGVEYIDENGVLQDTDTLGVTVTVLDATTGPIVGTLTNDWYLFSGTWNHAGMITVTGDVHIIIEDICNVTVTGGNNLVRCKY